MKCIRQRNMGLAVVLIACILFLNGCWGKREVEDLAPLIGIGFDLGQKPGTYLITEQFSIPAKGGETGADIQERTISVEASSGREAFEKISKIFYRTPFMGSLEVIVIGEDLAKAGFNEILDFGQRFSEFRRTMYLVLVKGKARDILNVKLRSEQLPAMAIMNMVERGSEVSSTPIVRLGHYFTILGSKSTAPILPMIETIQQGEGGVRYKVEGDETQEIQIQGAGVFRKDRFVDSLTDEETKGYMWLENQVKGRLINTVGIDEGKLNFAGQVMKSTTKYKVSDNDGTIGLEYQIRTSIAVDEVLGLKEQLSEQEWLNLMKATEKKFAKAIEKECQLALQKEKMLGLDFLGIGRHIEQKDSAYWKTIKDQWEQKIVDFPVSLDVQVTIHNSGMSSSSATTN
ncbi:MAG TPA: Ger(x)C family spore germination protein [Desulfosporosinus sp.]|nr:Ger(x)C family spore germination protein [Desulfosporosinus sp.]